MSDKLPFVVNRTELSLCHHEIDKLKLVGHGY